ncbi:MAG TPA: UDP-N-acetylmuramoyl-tripeptide--D-alanyl-D-alanine ligase [Candidatus Acidoferrales bacterium]|jgi:UDP-N-acetylmuramoyl-tripeptide--D-alanyl-D-alanine ligase|nr:UDP-N-acetylmuramoyl-tripeptide--D-alanyl-D-alanine ligase [Candidatus Acidoferrales bacterium]
MRWTVEEVARALGVTPPGGVDSLARLAGVSINSRTLAHGELFVAIHGPRHDGHNFVVAALEAGALAGVVAADRLSGFGDRFRSRLLAVPDTLAALQNLAQAVRTRWGRRLAAVTGSAGKTTTKEILAALLAARFRVLKSEGNLNNEFGLPLQLLRLEEADEAAVVELGMSHAGELRRLAEIGCPDVGVVTRVAPVHLEFFASVDEIALAKRELIESLAGPGSVAVLNADDARVASFAEVAPGRVLTYGVDERADFRAENIQDHGLNGSEFDFLGPEGRARLRLPLPGRHNISNALAALAAASVWGVGAAEAKDVFPKLEATGMRGRVLHYDAGFTVINDCYNSNPVALLAMAGLLANTPAAGRHLLAAGEMLELGPRSAELHREAGRAAAAATRDRGWIIGVQGEADNFVRGAVEAGHPAAQAKFFASSSEAGDFVGNLIERGDVLLVKGSRGVKMERIVEALDARFARANAEPAVSAASGPPKERA